MKAASNLSRKIPGKSCRRATMSSMEEDVALESAPRDDALDADIEEKRTWALKVQFALIRQPWTSGPCVFGCSGFDCVSSLELCDRSFLGQKVVC